MIYSLRKKISKFVKQNELLTFFVLAYFISWTLWTFSAVVFRGIPWFAWVVGRLGVYGPTIACLIIAVLIYPGKNKVKRNASWFIYLYILALAILIPILKEDIYKPGILIFVFFLLITAAILAIFYYGNTRFTDMSFERTIKKINIIWILLSVLLFPLIYLISKIYCSVVYSEMPIFPHSGSIPDILKLIVTYFCLALIFGGPFGEELGWRGFALPRLQKKYSPLIASLILSIIWSLWHLADDIHGPFFGSVLFGIIFRPFWSFPLTVIFTWFYNRTNGSILIALLLHSSINTSFELFPLTIISGGVFFLITIFITIIMIFSDKMWKKIQ